MASHKPKYWKVFIKGDWQQNFINVLRRLQNLAELSAKKIRSERANHSEELDVVIVYVMKTKHDTFQLSLTRPASCPRLSWPVKILLRWKFYQFQHMRIFSPSGRPHRQPWSIRLHARTRDRLVAGFASVPSRRSSVIDAKSHTWSIPDLFMRAAHLSLSSSLSPSIFSGLPWDTIQHLHFLCAQRLFRRVGRTRGREIKYVDVD